MKSTPLIIGGIFFVATGLCFGLSQFALRERWIVLNQPVRVEQGFSLSAPFTVDAATEYEVEIQYAKATDSQPPERDTDERRAFATAFSASVDQTPLIAGQRITINGNIYYSQGKPSSYIGGFRGVPGHTYRLDLRVIRDLLKLVALSPAVRVRVHSAHILDARNASAGVISLGLMLCFPGVICLLLHFLASRRRNANNNHPTELVPS